MIEAATVQRSLRLGGVLAGALLLASCGGTAAPAPASSLAPASGAAASKPAAPASTAGSTAASAAAKPSASGSAAAQASGASAKPAASGAAAKPAGSGAAKPAASPSLTIPASAPPGSAEHGKELFAKDGCYECHDYAGEGSAGTGPKLAPNPLPYPAFYAQVRTPRQDMPKYPVQFLSDQDLADIYAYVQSIPAPPSNIPLLTNR
ncbi:MAG TPA: cytochrome c [Chloroflexota bacterium]|nr:cytochrome c [Chloroflexota bacterium]